MALDFRTGLIIVGSMLTCSPALAIDPSCQPVLAATTALKTRPFHMFMSTEAKYSTPTFARAAASIGAAGIKKAEEVWTGKNMFVLHNDKWLDMGNTFGDPDASDDPDTKKAREAERCTVLADDTVAGQAATVIKTHNAELGIDGKYWISKFTHLPLRSETTTVVGPMKSVSSATYTYDHVQAPANAVSFKDMINHKAKD